VRQRGRKAPTASRGGGAAAGRRWGGLKFLAPFRQVARFSGTATIISLIGLLFAPSTGYPEGTGPEPLEVTIFSLAVLFFAWSVVGTVRLISIVQRHAVSSAPSERMEEQLKDAQEDESVAKQLKTPSEATAEDLRVALRALVAALEAQQRAAQEVENKGKGDR
jgi:hypothetical protein